MRCAPSRREFGELINRMRRRRSPTTPQRVSPGMLPGAYKVFTTIVRRESVTLSALAESLMADKGQISRTVRELEDLGLVTRTPDPDGRPLEPALPHARGARASRRRAGTAGERAARRRSTSGRSTRSAT